MKKSKKLILFVGLLVAVNLATVLVVSHNQRSGFYRPEADSIAIPIFNTLFLSLLAIPLLAIVTLFPNSSVAYKFIAKGNIHRVVTCLAVVVLYLPCAAIPLLGAAYWFGPRHYFLSATFAVAFIGLIASMAIDVQKLFSNNALQPTQTARG